MFSVYKTVHPPTGIENAIYCSFLSPNESNLITASNNKLNVYRLNSEYNKSKKLKLQNAETFNLFGNISTMASCRYGAMTKDALIIAFDDAKVRVIFPKKLFLIRLQFLRLINYKFFSKDFNSRI